MLNVKQKIVRRFATTNYPLFVEKGAATRELRHKNKASIDKRSNKTKRTPPSKPTVNTSREDSSSFKNKARTFSEQIDNTNRSNTPKIGHYTTQTEKVPFHRKEKNNTNSSIRISKRTING